MRKLLHFVSAICIPLLIISSVGCSKDPQDPAEGIVRAYYEVRDWKDRLPLVIDAERLQPLMARRYREVNFPVANLDQVTYSSIRKNSNLTLVRIERPNKPIVYYYVLRINGKLLIDWEASLGINEQTLIAFKSNFPKSEGQFRLIAQLDDYYNYEFRGAEQNFYSVSLIENGNSGRINGYISRRTDAGQRFFDLLKDGRYHNVIVKIQYSNTPEASSIVLITDMSEGWSLYN